MRSSPDSPEVRFIGEGMNPSAGARKRAGAGDACIKRWKIRVETCESGERRSIKWCAILSVPPVCRCSSGWLTLVCIIKRRGVEPEREKWERREREDESKAKKREKDGARTGGEGERDREKARETLCWLKKSEKAKE